MTIDTDDMIELFEQNYMYINPQDEIWNMTWEEISLARQRCLSVKEIRERIARTLPDFIRYIRYERNPKYYTNGTDSGELMLEHTVAVQLMNEFNVKLPSFDDFIAAAKFIYFRDIEKNIYAKIATCYPDGRKIYSDYNYSYDELKQLYDDNKICIILY